MDTDKVEAIFKEVSSDTICQNISVTADSSFNVVARVPLNDSTLTYSQQCDKWVLAFSLATKTSWIVSKTFPNLERWDYRKTYICQHSKKNKWLAIDSSKPRARNKECCASIDILVKKSSRNDPFMRKNLNAVIKVKSNHSHRVHVAEAYSFLRTTDAMRTTFTQYFSQGMSPAAAKQLHEVELLASADDSTNLVKLLADAQSNPTERQIYHLYDTWRADNFGERTCLSAKEIIDSKQNTYKENGIDVIVSENPFAIAIVTPIMKRAHSLHSSGEIVFVDSSGSCDQQGHCVTFVFGVTKVGGIPLGCVIHQLQTAENYTHAFNMLKEVIGPSGFGGKGEPGVVMTDDSAAERSALHAVFPSATLLLCIFHVCQAMWRWLWDSKHAIALRHRKALMMLFRGVMFATDKTSCEELMLDLCENNEVAELYPQFVNHFQDLWARNDEWCLSHRATIITRGHNTNNLVESSIRIFKDVVLERCKAFNAVALVDFVANVLEKYHTRRLVKYASSRMTKPELHYQRFCQKAKNLVVENNGENIFIVCSSEDLYMLYTVDTELEICSCIAGQGGSFCKHLCAVHLQSETMLNLRSNPMLTFEDKVTLAKVALGTVDATFFQSMDGNENESREASEINQNNAQEQMDYTEPDITVVEPVHTDELVAGFERVASLAASNPSAYASKLVNSMVSKLGKITTPAQALEFFASLSAHRSTGKRIRVQPTAISRRTHRPGMTSGAKRIQSGRPSGKSASKGKKKRCLNVNVAANQPNAKSHGKGH